MSPKFSAFAWLVLVSTPALASPPDEDTLVFEKEVRPLLKEHCFHCHGEEEEDVRAGLDVRLVRFLKMGGESGPAIVPGNPSASLLLEQLKSGEMPKGKGRLPDHEIAVIENWIAQGAGTARPEPESLGPDHQFTEEERSWWSLQPIEKPPIPDTEDSYENPIDAFVARRLQEKGLDFSPEADPRILARRVSFDLAGLPPTAELLAGEPDFEEVVDRLLASPAYGERWARHWLDVAGYADSDGYTEKDLERKHAWRYRDYVIRSLNGDKPYDAFVREQLAGDEIAALENVHANSPTEEGKARYEELMTATGFLRMAPDGTGAINNLTSRNDCITDTLKIVSTALYGLTIQCAQCHDHRYDPVSQEDYYRLRAVFEPGFDVPGWRNPNGRLVSLQTKEEAAIAAEIEAEAKKLDQERLSKQEEFIAEVLEKLLLKADEGIRDALRDAYRTEAKERSDEQNRLLAANPNVKQLSAGSLYLYDSTFKTKHANTLKEMAAKAAEVRKKKPEVRYVHAFAEVAQKPEAIPATHLFFRGDYESPKEKVSPGDLSVLGQWRDVSVSEVSDDGPTSGRRLSFARSLTDGEHPLLARVIVNRAWMHHFGRGLVESAGDFGKLGSEPTHPDLLNWLTADFMEHGWSLKRLHRQILTSRTWRQQSTRNAVRDEIDPDNLWLSRQNVRRLEAETIRDALLAVSGKLNPKRFGKPVPVMKTAEGSVVVGVDTSDSAGRPSGKYVSLEGEEFRRSVYIQVRRTRPLDMFQAFDAPDMMEANCEVRPVTTVSPQSLLLMNNAVMREFAQHFAEQTRSRGGPDLRSRVVAAWEQIYHRPPADDELAAGVEFVEAQQAYYEKNPAKLEKVAGPAEKENAEPELLALAALGHALMSANEFLYID